jgi:prepilin-type N-terminal cleavage/methylation domain-containing protein
MAMNSRISRSTAGFTLIEVLISLVILGFVLGGVMTLFSNTTKYNTSQEMLIKVSRDLRAAKLLMVDEIRSAACDPYKKVPIGFQDDADDMLNTDANSIHFTRDIDNSDNDQFYEPDGDADDPNEDIAYYRVNAGGAILNAGDNTRGTLVRNTGGGGQPIANNITNLQFQYYDSSNNLIDPVTMTSKVVLGRIRTVEVILSGQVENTSIVNPSNLDQTLSFRIRVRNM